MSLQICRNQLLNWCRKCYRWYGDFFEAIGINPGDEIIISSHTMLATASAIKVAGGKPIPVDIKDDDNLICTSAIEDAITENTVGIMPTQLNGRVCDMDSIKK